MNFHIQQSIHIHDINVGGITNASVLQVGSAGIVKPTSYLYNTGGFTQAAPQAQKPGTLPPSSLLESPAVPLQSPVR